MGYVMELNEVCEIPAFDTTSHDIVEILTSIRTVAIVGLSPKDDRESNRVARYLLDTDYDVIPVNPNYDKILGLRCYSEISEIPGSIDAVDIFRKPSAVPDIVRAAIEKGVSIIWMQEGIVNNEAADKAKSVGLKVVMNKCMMKEHMKMMQNRMT
jgi:predicted CoA-binding protein